MRAHPTKNRYYVILKNNQLASQLHQPELDSSNFGALQHLWFGLGPDGQHCGCTHGCACSYILQIICKYVMHNCQPGPQFIFSAYIVRHLLAYGKEVPQDTAGGFNQTWPWHGRIWWPLISVGSGGSDDWLYWIHSCWHWIVFTKSS